MSLSPPEDEITGPWWEGTRRRVLLVQRCHRCGGHQHYPRPACRSCASTNLAFVPAVGRGRLVTFTVVHRSPDPDRAPGYVVALVALDEGPMLVTNIVDAELRPADEESLRFDQEVLVDFLPLDDGRALPVFRPGDAEWTRGASA